MNEERLPRPRIAPDPAGHVFSVCGNCGEAWPSADPPIACVRCGKGPVHTTARCDGCEHCQAGSTVGGEA